MIDRELRCQTCNRYAYPDAFSGEYGEKGYTCSSCIKLLNDKAVAKWHQSNADCTRYVDKEQTQKGFDDLNQMINPLLKLGDK